MENKVLIIDEKDKKHKLMIENITKFKWIQEQLKSYKEWEKKLKEAFKQYDFEKVVITSESGNTTFNVTQYIQNRKELNEEKLLDALEDYIRNDFGMNDTIIDNQIQLRDELGCILDKAYETKEVKCIKYGVK